MADGQHETVTIFARLFGLGARNSQHFIHPLQLIVDLVAVLEHAADFCPMGAGLFEQAAGFLRVRNGEEPLDASAIHPESYATARRVLKLAGVDMRAPVAERQAALDALLERKPLPALAQELGCGEPTLADILEQIVRPGRDPRQDAPPPILRSDVLSMEDLVVGMRLRGVVRNVVDFGAFVDIGVKQDGLLHRSQLPVGERLSVGDVIEVEVASVDKERGRIALGLASI